MPFPTIVFDLDGTLVDSAPDLIDTLNVIFAREELPPVAFEHGRPLIGGGARGMIERGLAAEGLQLPPERIERMFRDFIDYYAEHIADRSRPFPGLEPALDALAQDGFRFAVCTNKLERLARLLLDALELSPRFAAICGADTFGMRKPDPEILRRTIVKAGGRPTHAIMVGDSPTDIATARAAAIPVIAVDFGYTETPVAQLGPDRVLSGFADLPSAVRELLQRSDSGAGIRRSPPY